MAEEGSASEIPQRAEYYKGEIEKFVSRYPVNFREFVDNDEIVVFEDQLLASRLSTAYNFAPPDLFPLKGDKPIIFYSNYVQRTQHFGELLAFMESEGIIDEDDISFGIKATKVFGNWKDPETVVGKIKTKDGKVIETSESVETVVAFHPNSLGQALEIGKFLLTKARKGGLPYDIQGAWNVPDSRARGHLKEILKIIGFKECMANTFRFLSGDIIILKQKTSYKERGWKSYSILVNTQLYGYLVEYGVEP